LDAISGSIVAEVVVAYPDRLSTLGMELLEWLFKCHHAEIVVLEETKESQSSNGEICDNLLAGIPFFVACNNGRRSATNRKRRAAAPEESQDEQEERRQAKRRKGPQDPRVPEPHAEGTLSITY
jgi:predicted site-specific integrase-resolvase